MYNFHTITKQLEALQTPDQRVWELDRRWADETESHRKVALIPSLVRTYQTVSQLSHREKSFPSCNLKKKRAYNTQTQIQQLKTQEGIPFHITLFYLLLLSGGDQAKRADGRSS